MTDEAIAKMENEWQLQKEAARLLELVVSGLKPKFSAVRVSA